MNYLQMRPDTVLIGFSGGDNSAMHIGTYIGFMGQPTYIIQTEAGQVHWAESLTRVATPEETIDYWRARALAAEAGR